jgi:hypothetical protein
VHLKVGAYQAIEGSIDLPLTGIWTGEFQLDTSEELTGTIDVSIADSMVFTGTVARSGVDGGRTHVMLVGGAGKFQTTVLGKHYYSLPVQTVLADMLAVVGEELDSSTPAEFKTQTIRHWVRAEGRMSREWDLFMSQVLPSFNWRITVDGLVWVGQETWADSVLANYVVLRKDFVIGQLEISAEVPTVYPGETFEEGQVVSVRHVLASQKLKTEVSFL